MNSIADIVIYSLIIIFVINLLVTYSNMYRVRSCRRRRRQQRVLASSVGTTMSCKDFNTFISKIKGALLIQTNDSVQIFAKHIKLSDKNIHITTNPVTSDTKPLNSPTVYFDPCKTDTSLNWYFRIADTGLPSSFQENHNIGDPFVVYFPIKKDPDKCTPLNVIYDGKQGTNYCFIVEKNVAGTTCPP